MLRWFPDVFCRLWRGFVALVLICGLIVADPISATAQTPMHGQYDLAFQHAVAGWLAGDEEHALPALASLSRKGNAAARVLLAMVDKSPELQGPWLSLLDREARVSLMRRPGVFSGSSWMKSLPDIELARDWIAVWAVRSDVKTALRFARAGENRAARQALISLEARQGKGFATYADDPFYPKSMRYLIWREVVYQGGNIDAMDGEADALLPGDPQRVFMDSNVRTSDLQDWLAQADIGAPLQALCTTACAVNPGQCMRAGFNAMGGYHGLASLGSPVANLISEARFAASVHGQNTVLRRSLLNAQISERRLALITKQDACFARLLEEEAQKF